MIQLIRKDIKLFFTDKKSVILTFLLPIILISLFAFAFGGIGGTSKAEPIALLYVDADLSTTSQKLIASLDSLDGLTLIASTLEESQMEVTKGNFAGALLFQKGLEDSIELGNELPIELIYDQAREMEIGMLQPVLISSLMTNTSKQTISKNIENYLAENFTDVDAEVKNKILNDANGDSNNSFEMNNSIKMTSIVGADNDSQETNLGLIQAVAGTAILMLLFSVAGLGTSILEEKENGTLKRLLYAPTNSSTILYAKMFFTFLIAILQLTVMFLFSYFVFHLDLTLNIPALILMILATSFAVSSFGIFLAAISKTRQQAQSYSTLIILTMSAIGGSMIPLFIMPAIMKKIAVFSLNYWGIQGFYDIFWRNLPLIEILPRIGVLLVIGMVMTFFSIRLFKKNILNLV